VNALNFKDMGKIIDLSGKSFGNLTVISRVGSKGKDSTWNCLCKCGNHKIIRASSIKVNKSCGCMIAELNRQHRTTHGKSRSKEYLCWIEIIRRCTDPKRQSYSRYGGRGIKVCDRWIASFEHFYHDMGPAPSKQHSIERNDTESDYSPNNCRWATAKEQANNRSSNWLIEWGGSVKSLAEWCSELQLPYQKTWRRLKRNNWPLDKAFKV
jgi:hypothetical protein